MKTDSTYSVLAFSNPPAFPCSACQHANYPTTHAEEVLDGDEPLPLIVQPSHKEILRLYFNGPYNAITMLPVTNIYQMKGAMRTIALTKGYSVGMLHFIFDGERVCEEDTAEEVSLKHWNPSPRRIC